MESESPGVAGPGGVGTPRILQCPEENSPQEMLDMCLILRQEGKEVRKGPSEVPPSPSQGGGGGGFQEAKV